MRPTWTMKISVSIAFRATTIESATTIGMLLFQSLKNKIRDKLPHNPIVGFELIGIMRED